MTAAATREPGTALAEREAGEGAAAARVTSRLFEPDRPTLEDSVLTAWDELAAGHHPDCLVCGAPTSPAAGCTVCGSELS
jgi:hypothetical protein